MSDTVHNALYSERCPLNTTVPVAAPYQPICFQVYYSPGTRRSE